MTVPPDTQPVSLRVSVTDRCQYRCVYCTPASGVELFDHSQILRYEQTLQLVRILQRHMGLTKVHLTGGEPLVRRGLVDFVRMLAAEGLADIALTTNGRLLPEFAADLARAGLRRVNVSLDSLQPDTFRRITRGGELQPTLDGIAAARESGLRPVKLNTTVLGGINDQESVPLVRFALRLGVALRFIELMPLGPAAEGFEGRFVPAQAVLDRLVSQFEMTPLPRRAGSSTRWFVVRAADGRAGRIGVISPCSQPFCGDCRRLRLTARGELMGCLALGAVRDLAPLLPATGEADVAAVLAEVQAALRQKRTGQCFPGGRNMVQVGG
jgi:cyclic pyranopterin phosphate synthase